MTPRASESLNCGHGGVSRVSVETPLPGQIRHLAVTPRDRSELLGLILLTVNQHGRHNMDAVG